MNRKLEEAHYFYSDIKREGILLYDAGEFTLSEARQVSDLDNEKRRQISIDYFDQWFESGSEFIKGCEFYLKENIFKKSAFELHQAVECLCQCSLLVLTGESQRFIILQN